MPLPIESALPSLLDALSGRTEAVLHAPPGAGKTTRVPLALLGAPWLAGRRIVMLEPRRIAARAAARFMARGLGESVGATIGYRMRDDTRVGPGTRVEVVTEGVLTRMLQEDPALTGIGCLVFDEFHERSLQADLGLALALEAREAFSPDLRIVVMSATLAADAVSRLLDRAPVIRSEGRLFDVETHHAEQPPTGPIEPVAAAAVRRALQETEGDILVFLPGTAEIRRTADLLDGLPGHVDVRPLHGTLAPDDQDAAIEASPSGRRKVVLATDIAETSLTIEGVRVVVDAGLVRQPAFDPRSGMTRLVTRPVTRASADQRRGRAGRLANGTCYRLWTRFDHGHRTEHPEAEILQADLAPLALDLAAWGLTDPSSLRWLDPPPEAAWRQATRLLQDLGALDAAGRVSDHGRAMAAFAAHPRLAHMILAARNPAGRLAQQDPARTLAGLACDLAALVEGASPLGRGEPDLRLEVHALRGGREATSVARAVVERVRRESERLQRSAGVRAVPEADPEAAGLLLALAYPDRIGERVADARFRLANGRQAEVPTDHPFADAAFLVAADVGGTGRSLRIFRAAPVTREDVEAALGDRLETVREVRWNPVDERVEAVQETRLGAVVLRSAPWPGADADDIAAALLAALRERGPATLPWSRDARQLQQRLLFLRRRRGDWPDVSDEALLAGDLLKPWLYGMTRLSDVSRLDLVPILTGLLPTGRQRDVGRLAPSHLTVPSGSRLPVDYSDPEAPGLAVRLQEVFGLLETPLVDGVPLTLHLLSPAHRPVQVTRDLESFWRTAYFDVRRDLRGRYPKHWWPEDPLEAMPTARAKPRT